MKIQLYILILVAFLQVPALARSRRGRENTRFPLGPELSVTPGELCDKPDAFRYPEKIPYCERAVGSKLKWDIIRTYDREFGFQIEKMNRTDFKIDHFIPLCMGGSNDRLNLWPQHRSVFEKTDKLEQTLCELMSKGRLKQAEAVERIRDAKMNLDRAEDILADSLKELGRRR